jgi:murein L,D-transpeptidase YafK
MKNQKIYLKGVFILLILLFLILILKDFNKPLIGKIDFIVVNKDKREMLVFDAQKQLLKNYTITLGFCPKGKKSAKGDGRTPEGIYYINGKNSKSIAHKNLGISYPNAEDIKNSILTGKETGGDIKIHGLMNKFWFVGKLHRLFDWTNGCIAVNNSEMDELYANVPIGTKIIINP